MKYTTKAGLTVEGTLPQIKDALKKLGEKFVTKGYYYSESKGEPQKISDMATPYLKNALLKLSTEHFNALAKKKTITNKAFVQEYVSLTENQVVAELFTELTKR